MSVTESVVVSRSFCAWERFKEKPVTLLRSRTASGRVNMRSIQPDRSSPVSRSNSLRRTLKTAGQVHSLAGENGAGKSTLVKILGGIHQPDSGLILKNGIATAILGSADARRQGIAVIHQHPPLFPTFRWRKMSLSAGSLVGWVGLSVRQSRSRKRFRLVVTIGTLALFRGIAQIVLNERGVSGFPEWYQNIGFDSNSQ
jgi:ABC-type Fe3+/spermidine/putrescine transport system ATPase subunit